VSEGERPAGRSEEPSVPPAPPELDGRQRRHLRGLAHALRPLVQVGEAGLGPPVLRAVDEALHRHELVKVRLHEPEDKRALARALAEGTGAALCGLVGHTVILYRPNPEAPRIQLPARAESGRARPALRRGRRAW
jgi:RNA-binding protein